MSDSPLRISKQAATVRAMVEAKLRHAIVSGHFRPGERLVERDLCETIGVGRTSVREALRQLEAEGLIETVPHRGPTVSTIDEDEARQLYAIRALLEGYAGEQFARHASDDDIARLEAIVAELSAAAQDPEPGRLLRLKSAFYACLMDGAGNRFVKQMLTLFHNRINVLRARSMLRPGRLQHSVEELRAICDAIAARDPAAAAMACRTHIDNAAEAALAELERPAESVGR